MASRHLLWGILPILWRTSSNQRGFFTNPLGFEPETPTASFSKLVPGEGIEPPTKGL